ncbi:MAG: hypothetical protein RBQ72_02765 [Desulfobacterium sp.]|jgi:hypothetical protein|nr:hypothetical protein [Desulfobacterium sp.]
MKSCKNELEVRQVNCFYNYTVGLVTADVNLLKTAAKLLKSGMARTVCFSDLKCVYLDDEGDVQFEWLRPQGRQWNSGWTVKFSDDLPRSAVKELTICLELSFHEQRIESPEARQMAPHIRAALPPLVLEQEDMTLLIYPWLKVFSDGIVILSFQLDTTWDGLSEADFVSDIVNIYQRYFDRVWVHAELQRLDAEQVIPDAFERELSIGGQEVVGRKSKKLLKEMRHKSQLVLKESLGKKGRDFEIGEETWTLHQIAGSEEQDEWEATIDLCRSLYVNAMAGLVVPGIGKKSERLRQVLLWQGHPSISLMRFRDQPGSKEVLLKKFGPSLSRVLMRSSEVADPPVLPSDLRVFGDYCFHANRALLLWTWLRPNDSPDDAWEDSTTRAQLLENQGRAEHFEYHNMRIARACATANSPPSDQDLIGAYEVLASADSVIHNSSQAGEITDALSYLMTATGTTGLIESGKEQARWHLDERRYRADKNRSRVDRWLAVVFGFVGAAGLADLVIQPFLEASYPELRDGFRGLVAFSLAALFVGVVALFIWNVHRCTSK